MFAFILTCKCKSSLTDLEQAHKSNLPKFSHFSFLAQFDQRQNFSLSITVSSLLGNRLWCRKSKTSLKFCERSQRFKKLKDLSGRETTRQEGFVIMTCCRHFVITFYLLSFPLRFDFLCSDISSSLLSNFLCSCALRVTSKAFGFPAFGLLACCLALNFAASPQP